LRILFEHTYIISFAESEASSSLGGFLQVAVKCKWFGRPTYTVTVNAGADCAFVLLLVMIMEKRAKEHEAQVA
jgi:hypothetical protein